MSKTITVGPNVSPSPNIHPDGSHLYKPAFLAALGGSDFAITGSRQVVEALVTALEAEIDLTGVTISYEHACVQGDEMSAVALYNEWFEPLIERLEAANATVSEVGELPVYVPQFAGSYDSIDWSRTRFSRG